MGNHVIRDRLWRSRKLARCSKQAALAYPWLYLVADEWGRFEHMPNMIHGLVFGARMDCSPEDSPTVAEVAAWLSEYEEVGLLIRYGSDGDLAVWTNFEGRPASKRRKSQYPEPQEFKSVRPQDEDASLEQEQEQELELELEQEQEPPLPPAGAGDSDSVRQVFERWQSVMGHAAAKLTPKRRRSIQSRLREGYAVAQLCDAVAGCKASPFHMGQNDSGTVYDDLTLICRSGEKVEFFLGKLSPLPVQAVGVRAPRSGFPSNAERLDRKVARLLGGGS